MRTITIGGVAGLVLACALPLAGKTACRTSADCVDERVCVEGQCRDGACETLCSAICDAADDCDGEPQASCDTRCIAGDLAMPPLVPTLAPASCRDLWDLWPTDDACDELECVLACASLCDFAQTCGVVVDARACFVGCVARNDSCGAAMPTDCVFEPHDVLCYEDADACQ